MKPEGLGGLGPAAWSQAQGSRKGVQDTPGPERTRWGCRACRARGSALGRGFHFVLETNGSFFLSPLHRRGTRTLRGGDIALGHSRWEGEFVMRRPQPDLTDPSLQVPKRGVTSTPARQQLWLLRAGLEGAGSSATPACFPAPAGRGRLGGGR